jgi:hypothetical protein
MSGDPARRVGDRSRLGAMAGEMNDRHLPACLACGRRLPTALGLGLGRSSRGRPDPRESIGEAVDRSRLGTMAGEIAKSLVRSESDVSDCVHRRH